MRMADSLTPFFLLRLASLATVFPAHGVYLSLLIKLLVCYLPLFGAEKNCQIERPRPKENKALSFADV